MVVRRTVRSHAFSCIVMHCHALSCIVMHCLLLIPTIRRRIGKQSSLDKLSYSLLDLSFSTYSSFSLRNQSSTAQPVLLREEEDQGVPYSTTSFGTVVYRHLRFNQSLCCLITHYLFKEARTEQIAKEQQQNSQLGKSWTHSHCCTLYLLSYMMGPLFDIR
jgi:hypothetical protein